MITGPLHSGKNFIRHCSEKNTKKKLVNSDTREMKRWVRANF